MMSGLVAVVFIVGTVMISWAVYFGMRRVMGEDYAEDTQTLAGSVIIRVASLHGLILALVFAQELVDYTQLQGNLTEEATAIADPIMVWGTCSMVQARLVRVALPSCTGPATATQAPAQSTSPCSPR